MSEQPAGPPAWGTRGTPVPLWCLQQEISALCQPQATQESGASERRVRLHPLQQVQTRDAPLNCVNSSLANVLSKHLSILFYALVLIKIMFFFYLSNIYTVLDKNWTKSVPFYHSLLIEFISCCKKKSFHLCCYSGPMSTKDYFRHHNQEMAKRVKYTCKRCEFKTRELLAYKAELRIRIWVGACRGNRIWRFIKRASISER